MAENLEFVIGARDQFSKSFSKLGSMLPSISRMAGVASIAFAGLSASIFAMVKTTATAYDKIQKLSDRLGVSTMFLSKMAYAADLSGINIETMNKAVEMLSVRIQEASKGTGLAVEAFNKLNVTLYDNNGQLRTSADIMPDIAEAFGNMTNATERTAAAYQIFGMRGTAMIQMFKGGKDGLAAMTDEAEKFGLVISARAGANAAEFNDSLTRLTGSMKGVKNKFSEELMPILTAGFNKLADIIANNRDRIVDSFRAIANGMVSFVDILLQGAALSVRGLEMIFGGIDKVLSLYQKINEFGGDIAGIFSDDLAWAFNHTAEQTIKLRASFQNTADNVEAFEKKIQALRVTLSAFFADIRDVEGTDTIPGLPGADAQNTAYAEAAERALKYHEYVAALNSEYGELAMLNAALRAQREIEIEQQKADAINGILSNMASVGAALGKEMFYVAKAANIAQAIMSTYTGATNAFRDVPYPFNFAASAAIVVAGLANVARIKAQKYSSAHGGLTNVPKEQTYLLDQGERVLSPNQNADLIKFMEANQGASITGNTFQLSFPNTDLTAMSKSDIEDFTEQKLIPALKRATIQGIY